MTGRGYHDGVGMQGFQSSQSSQPSRQPLGEVPRNVVGNANIPNMAFGARGAYSNQPGKVNLFHGRHAAPFYGGQE